MRNWWLFVVLALPAAGQTVEGDVVDSVTGQPIAGVAVGVTAPSQRVYYTDAAGRFSIPASPVTPQSALRLNRAGYLSAEASLAGGEPAAGPRRLKMIRQSVISGRVTDEDGAPVEGVRVSAWEFQERYGKWQWVPAEEAVKTDDRGEFRLPRLTAGRYCLFLDPGESALAWLAGGYQVQYRGGTLDAEDAQAVQVPAGEEMRNVDCVLRRTVGVTVRGRVVLPQGMAKEKLPSVPYLWRGEGALGGGEAAKVEPDGRFVIPYVRPGKYRLRYEPNGGWRKAGDLEGDQALEVGGRDVDGVELRLAPVTARVVAGRVVNEKGEPVPGLQVTLSGRGVIPPVVQSGADGSFQLPAVPVGRYRVTAQGLYERIGAHSAVARALPASVRLGEQEVLDREFDVTAGAEAVQLRVRLEPTSAMVRGRVMDAAGVPLRDCTLSIRRLNSETPLSVAITDRDGRFEWRGFPGSFRVQVMPNDLSYPMQLRGGAKAAFSVTWRVVAGANPEVVLRAPGR